MGSLTREQFAHAAALEQHQARAAELNNMAAGERYALLSGNPAQAAEWVHSAAESGVMVAQVQLGRMLLEGYGLPQDRRAALRWFQKAARQRDADALNMVGRCHELGWGAPIDLSLAALHYRCSAEAGHDWGQYNLAGLLFDGRGVPQNLREAFGWFLRAALQGHARAMNLLARCLEEGWGCQRCPAEAAYWFRCSAEAGYFRAQYNYALELLLKTGDRAAAASWLWKSAQTGDAGMRSAILCLLAHLNDAYFDDLSNRMLPLL